jgi:hypothetical protein
MRAAIQTLEYPGLAVRLAEIALKPVRVDAKEAQLNFDRAMPSVGNCVPQ